jgi:hypothetical protein
MTGVLVRRRKDTQRLTGRISYEDRGRDLSV